MSDPLAATPPPPYYAVIFSAINRDPHSAEYQATAQRMLELAGQQPGFLGVETVHDGSSFGITVSYWTSLETIRAWRDQTEHQLAQQLGKEKWYQRYRLRVCRVEAETVM